MLDSITTSWSRPFKIVRVMQALAMTVPRRLRRERLAFLLDVLRRSGIEAQLADGSDLESGDSPGIEAKIRLRTTADVSIATTEVGYKVLAPIPGGGMALCFKVRDQAGNTRFLKKVPLHGVNAGALRREVEIYDRLKRASASHVLQVFAHHETPDSMSLLLELADGGTLAEFRERGDLDLNDVKQVATEILTGLRELHALGIIHRDLKPQNVLLSNGRWKLSDFGTSKVLGQSNKALTFQRSGTPGYTAPEQWTGVRASASADVYSFGKLLVFLMTGETDIDYLYDLPPLARLARRCTEFEPTRRPTLDEIEKELAQI